LKQWLKNVSAKDHVRVITNSKSVAKSLKKSDVITLVERCEEANIVFAQECLKKPLCRNIPVIGLNYEILKRNEHIIGAFYWKKGRPNLIFIQQRLEVLGIKLPDSFEPYIEERVW
jgi:hypothetical protein